MNYFYKKEDLDGDWWDKDNNDKIAASFHQSSVKPEFGDNLKIGNKLYSIGSLGSEGDDTFAMVQPIIFKEEPDTEIEGEITCPYCGYQSGDSWEASDSDDGRECSGCGSTYSYERNIDVTYHSEPVKKNDQITNIP